MKIKTLSMAVGLAMTGSAMAANLDFGQLVESTLKDKSKDLFGIERPLGASSSASLTGAQIDTK